MGMTVNPTSVTALTTNPGLSSVALAQSASGATHLPTAALTVTPVDIAANEAFMDKWIGVEALIAANGLEPAAMQNQTSLSTAAATLAKYQQALDSNARTGQDAQAVATALMSSTQQLILQRPDLANARFDFQSNNGAVKVTSSALSDSDRTWLQNLLNSNGSLVQAVQSFHNDLVGGYSAWANADGNPLTDAQLDAVGKQADGLVSFMNLFKQMGASSKVPNSDDKDIYTLNGAKIDLTQDPGSAVGFLGFMQSAQAVANGADVAKTPIGNFYGTEKFNVFEQNLSNSWAIRIPFFPSDATSLGTNEIA
ncbi:hypothetical protein [Caballeronia sordidicola]|uniref:Uncharacterized protein n=1 Tax=Caballeronia sordidicola TaxID=196367 RepID=A0A242M3C2_CABSO|nr:hypothetical protein [Caballeronia sordidicola]OTP65692.1 hypothetical protein PAMC26577_38855 [Caballeronia sordidicola]